MSNERIDLTEFEDMVAAEESLNLEGANGHDMCDMVRTLITELKRCYEKLDAVKHEVETCSECGGHREEEGTFHYCQNYCRCEEFDASK